MSDLLKRAEEIVEQWADQDHKMWPAYVRVFSDFAARVRELEAERDDYKSKWHQSNRELHDAWAERDALRALLREFYDNGYDRERCYAALGDRHE